MKGIENLKLALFAVISAAKTFKFTKKPLVSILLNVGKFVKVNYKEVGKEVKDLTADERRELVDWLAYSGFGETGIERFIANLGSEKRSTLKNLVQDLTTE